MRILLDENLDWRLRRDLPGHQVESVPLIGWASIQNGALLCRAAKDGFDVLVTMDGGILHQQNIARLTWQSSPCARRPIGWQTRAR